MIQPDQITPNKSSFAIIDDDEDYRFLMKLALQRANHSMPILLFADGQTFIDYLNENSNTQGDTNRHWLVIMDFNMPRLNGLETLKVLQQNSCWAKLPVLMLSTSDDPALIEEFYNNGACGFYTKPDSFNRFVEIFDKFFAPWFKS